MKLVTTSYRQLYQAFFFLIAITSLFLGILGIFLPGLPTTPFILLSAWAASKSSPRLQHWLEQHRVFGSLIRDWNAGHSVSRKSKWLATCMMSACALILLLAVSKLWIVAISSSCLLVTLVWLWQRPEPTPPDVTRA